MYEHTNVVRYRKRPVTIIEQLRESLLQEAQQPQGPTP